MCPVCTVTVVAGLGISRLLGIDDVITSIWIGGFALSFSFVTYGWISKKWPKLRAAYGEWITAIFVYSLVLIPLKLNGSIGIERNTLWGIDKIILGTFAGSVAFLAGAWADRYQRTKFKKIFFPYQKVIFPVLALIITSLIFYFLNSRSVF